MLDLLCFQWQDLGSKGASEVENLHLPNQLFPLCVCQKSSKSNIFDGKRANEAKKGETKKPNFDKMLDLLCFQWQSLGWKGAWEIENLHVPNQIFPLCVCQIHSSPTFLRVKGLARRKVVKPKTTGFTRCSTYSASNDKISSEGELKKMKLCM